MADSAQNIAFSAIFREQLHISPGREGFLSFGGPSRQFAVHRHRELEFNLVVEGTARYLLRDRQYHLRPGTLIWLFPEQDHVLMDRSPDYRHWVVCFRPERVHLACQGRETALLREANPMGWFCAELPDESVHRLAELLTEISAVLPEENDRFNTGLGYALVTAWSLYQRTVQRQEAPGTTYLHPGVQVALQAIQASVRAEGSAERNLSLPELAARCDLSADHLSRLFRREVGISIVAFRNQERIRRFIELDKMGKGRTVLDVALEVGFGSYAQFHRIFCKQMGITPQEYRRLWKEKERESK